MLQKIPFFGQYFGDGDLSSNEADRIWKFFVFASSRAICFWMVANLIKSRPGRAIRAIRDNETSAAVSGVHLSRYKTMSFGVASALGGVGGIVYVAELGIASPGDFSQLLAIFFIVGLVVGGVGTLSGAVVGGIVIAFVPEWSSSTTDVPGVPERWLQGPTGTLVLGHPADPAHVRPARAASSPASARCKARVVRVVTEPARHRRPAPTRCVRAPSSGTPDPVDEPSRTDHRTSKTCRPPRRRRADRASPELTTATINHKRGKSMQASRRWKRLAAGIDGRRARARRVRQRRRRRRYRRHRAHRPAPRHPRYDAPAETEAPADTEARRDRGTDETEAPDDTEAASGEELALEGQVEVAAGTVLDLDACPDDWSPTQGVDGDEIRIGMTLPQSGQLASFGPIGEGMGFYFDYINETDPIDDKNLVLVTKDDGYEAGRAVANVEEMLDTEDIFAFAHFIGTPINVADARHHRRGVRPAAVQLVRLPTVG